MKTIRIRNLHIENFKGLPSLDIEFGDTQTDIYGDNATGKTTVGDAFHWVLFGKDSENQTAFNIKPLRSNGEVAQHGAVTSVTATLTVDGKDCELRKEYAEKWIKKRGSTNPVFSGHETTYSVDGVPKKKSEYERFITELLDEDTFRILTSPAYFASVLPWQKRRDVLMSLGGNVSDSDVLAANDGLEPIRGELEKHSHADLITKLKADRQRVNKKRSELPIRIDELRRSMPPVSLDEDTERTAADNLTDQIAEAEAELVRIKAGDSSAEIADLTETIAALRDAAALEAKERLNNELTARAAYENERRGYEQRIANAQSKLDRLNREIRDSNERVNALRCEYETAAVATWNDDGICPTCGQTLPAEQLREKEEAFNIDRSNRLTQIHTQGSQLKAEISKKERETIALEEAIRSETAGLSALVPVTLTEYTPEDTLEIEALVKQRDAIRNGSQAQQEAAEKAAADRVRELRSEQETHLNNLSQIEAAKTTAARIASLDEDERTLAAEIERLDEMIYACEQFTRTKVELVESRINGMFAFVRWRLFREQINGGLDECCDLTVNGVPWADLNSAMRINAGIDLINALSAYYDVSAPVIIDNAESVSQLEPLDGQLIRLVVSEQDKELRVEIVE